MSAITDEKGRYIAEAQPVIAPRPAGPWQGNHDARPTAVYVYSWHDFDPPLKIYRVIGGPSHDSDLCAASLRALGIAVPR